MRALNLTMQQEIMASVQAYLATTPFLFNASYAQVIPGTAEGIYGWITTNYALQVLQNGDSQNTFGALDIFVVVVVVVVLFWIFDWGRYGRSEYSSYVRSARDSEKLLD